MIKNKPPQPPDTATLKYVILLIGATVLIGLALKGNITHERFDAEKWKNWTESEAEWSLRWDMMNSLRHNYALKGMSKAEILTLLGEPEGQSKGTFSYYLGMAKWGIDTGFLRIEFDTTGKVVDYKVWRG